MINTNNRNIIITLLNITSLKKHSVDIKFDSVIAESDVLAFTETKFLPGQDISSTEQNLNSFKIIRQDYENNFLSLTMCIKENLCGRNKTVFTEINGLYLTLQKLFFDELNVLLIYRGQHMDKYQFLRDLQAIITGNEIDLIFGDFNIITMKQNQHSLKE